MDHLSARASGSRQRLPGIRLNASDEKLGLDWISSIKLASSLRTVLARLPSGQATSKPAGDGLRRLSASCLVKDCEASQRGKLGFSRMTGIRSWIGWVSSLAAVVTMAAVPCNSFAFSQRPANAMGSPSRRVMQRAALHHLEVSATRSIHWGGYSVDVETHRGTRACLREFLLSH